MTLERTLVVLKPDTVGRSIIGEIITRFERAGLHLVALKMAQPDKDFLFHHYETIGKMISRRGQKPFDLTLELMLQSPVVAMIWEGVEAVSFVRKLVGTTEPKSAAPGTIRGDYAHMSFDYANGADLSVANLVHASGDPEEAALEIAHWFTNTEIFTHEPLNKKFTR